ncbi:MAG: OmpA family protein [Bacteroidales bacterium]|jgi:outer membrane protein OmpA-like peptidoglycan-associated protein/tetratricopeptide (TPR) repeat protein
MIPRHWPVKFFTLLFSLFFFFSVTACPQTADSCARSYYKKIEKSYHEGIDFFKKSNYTEAVRIMKNIVNKEPDFTDAYYVLGLSYFKRTNSNFRDAEKNFLKVIELCPSYNVYAYYYLAEICYGSEKYDSAMRYCEAFLKDVDKIKSDKDYSRAVDLLKYSKFYLQMTHNPVPFDPKVVEGISTPENEYLPIITADNQMAFFTRETKLEGEKNTLIQSEKYKEKFMFSQLQPDGKFTKGEEMPDPFNLNDNEGGATLTVDNKTLYYTVCKYTLNHTYYNCDIYYSELVDGEWTPIKSVSDKINLPTTWESQPSISADGKTLYFISDRSGGFGGYDIYRSVKNDNGEWGTPINLGPTINSTGNEKSPFIHPDGKTLYFSSDGWLGLGGYDIFYSRLKDDGTWSTPVNIGYPINSPDDEVGFFVSTDGQKGYFASNKLKGVGGWDLYSFDLYDKAKPGKVLFVSGTVRAETETEMVQTRIELKNMETKKISEIPLDSITGKYVAVAPFNNDYIMTVKKEGYVYETRYIARDDSIYRMPAHLDLEIQQIELNKSYRINDIYFAFNSFDLTGESKAVLDLLIEFLEENPSIYIEIQGHTDNIGNDADNLKLSANRAKSVYNYLIVNNIAPKRLTYKGYGKTVPVASNDTEEGRAKNRRTVFVIIRK